MTTTTQHHHTNRLIDATSPYLLQHAHNPVDWYPWGPDALERARKENKPIFLSIGYSACHWCHVMERECFENDEIAAVMNEHFINIKVDREERPDLDDIYMSATQAFTGSGGWPMSVWLTPELKPFFAGTYFPPDSRYGRPGFKDLLLKLSEIWNTERDKIVQQAEMLTDAVRKLSTLQPGDQLVPHDAVLRAANFLARAFDPVEGGVSSGQNKFPPSMSMDILLRAWHDSRGGDERKKADGDKMLRLVELTLEKMARGGIYDHLGGGIARYSTDPKWLVPHFEKMLYDQALVSDIYLKGFQATGNPDLARVAREIFDYVIADLQSPEGGFYSTRDADSEGEEGKFYVWTKDEVVAILGESDAAPFCDYYDVTDVGNWEHENILNVKRPIETVAKLHGVSAKEFESRIARGRQELFAAREKRIKPHLDDKILAAWNGLMIASLARGYRILGDERYRDAAVRAAQFVLARMADDNGRLLRTCRRGTAHTPAYLDDYAFMIEACLNLYETTFDVQWLDHASRLNDLVMKHFRDESSGGFYFAADDAEKTLVRAKDANDGAIPSGNAVQLMNLLRLAVLLDRQDLTEEAERVIRAFSIHLGGPSYFRGERMLAALDYYHRRPREVAFVTDADAWHSTGELVHTAWRMYVPNLTVAGLVSGSPAAEQLAKRIPLLAGKKSLDGEPTAFVCRHYACQAPTIDPSVLRDQLAR